MAVSAELESQKLTKANPLRSLFLFRTNSMDLICPHSSSTLVNSSSVSYLGMFLTTKFALAFLIFIN